MLEFVLGILAGVLSTKFVYNGCKDSIKDVLKQLSIDTDPPSIAEIEKDINQLQSILNQAIHFSDNKSYTLTDMDSPYFLSTQKKDVKEQMERAIEKLSIHRLNIRTIIRFYEGITRKQKKSIDQLLPPRNERMAQNG